MGQTVKAKLRVAFLQFSDADWPTELLRIQKQINNCPTRVLDNMTPHEALYGQPDPMPMQPKSGSYKELLGDPDSDRCVGHDKRSKAALIKHCFCFAWLLGHDDGGTGALRR